jgi:hypothetical protein
MLLEIMLAPLLATTFGWVDGARALTVIVLVAALSVVGLRRVTLMLFIPALIAHLMASRSNASPVVAASATLKLIFFGYVMARIVWHVLHDRSVTLDTIAGTACAYMLLGVVWGNLFQLVEHVSPGSFDLPSGWTIGPEKDPRAALMYFSFVTLTTVGYGDIKPANLGAGGLCVCEAIVGQLYLAIMIARMVGLQITQRTS